VIATQSGDSGPTIDYVTEPKPLRADARRNRARVLEAAEAVFAGKGTSAPTEEVAKAAGVGIGTVFRHFPTKEALLEAVLLDRMRRFAEEAEALGNAANPGEAFYEFLGSWVSMASAKNAYSDALAAAGVELPTVGSQTGFKVRAALGRLLERAQQVGAVRPDVGVAELIALMIGASRAAEHLEDPAVLGRALEIVFDGLRPNSHTP
jgi:AcrR family transcriptional regulator